MPSRLTPALCLAGILTAAAVALTALHAGPALAQPAGGALPAAMRIATVDTFDIAQKMMNAPELVKTRNDADATWQPRLQAIEEAARQIDERLRTLQQTDPQVQQLFQQRQAKVQEYQALLEQRQQALEKSNSDQLIEVYLQLRAAVGEIAAARGYTHVLSTGSANRHIDTVTVADTLQQVMARPVLVYPAGDDITGAVIEKLGIQEQPAPAAQPAPQNPPPAPPTTPLR
jgi:Skp family chaperone for outer membrane proteins